ncbi:hypothetical protein [Frankia sp. Cr1]|uniref:hypothetical protein n=1 Tax=Frankia sp. Cr1 TaxID=3073931 RepID=UPI002AD2F34D|nr:hypothetical protein [Frankia sp. Cr1]
MDGRAARRPLRPTLLLIIVAVGRCPGQSDDQRWRAARRSSQFHAHLDHRAAAEPHREDVTDVAGVAHTRVEAGHQRSLTTVFGSVTATRMAYRSPGAANLHPADAQLNLLPTRHSHVGRSTSTWQRGGMCISAMASGLRAGARARHVQATWSPEWSE